MTKHAVFPQFQYTDKIVVDMLVVLQRKVPQIRDALKTVEAPCKLMRWSSSLRGTSEEDTDSECAEVQLAPGEHVSLEAERVRLRKVLEHLTGQSFGDASLH